MKPDDGFTAPSTMQMTGHKTRSVFERYNIVSECDLLDAAKKLNALSAFAAAPLRRDKQDTEYAQALIEPNCDGLAALKPRSGVGGHNLGTVAPKQSIPASTIRL